MRFSDYMLFCWLVGGLRPRIASRTIGLQIFEVLKFGPQSDVVSMTLMVGRECPNDQLALFPVHVLHEVSVGRHIAAGLCPTSTMFSDF